MMSKQVILYMFCYGFAYSVPRYLLMMATEDILSGTLIQSSVVIILFGSASTISTVCSPFVIKKISFLRSIALYGIMWLISYVLLVTADDPRVRLLGVAFIGIMDALAHILILLLAANFTEVQQCVSAYSTGETSVSLFVGLLYTGSTVWLCISPKLTTIIISPLGLLAIFFYAKLNHGPLKKYQTTDNQEHTKYTPLHVEQTNEKNTYLSIYHRLSFLFSIFPVMGGYFVNYLAYFLAANSVLTTLAFPSAPFRARDHYQYYRLVADIGTFLGGMEMMMISYICPCWKKDISPRYCTTSILLLASIGHLLFFAFASWYRFVPSVYIILVLSFSHGVLYGSINVRGVLHISESFKHSQQKGTAMSISTIGAGFGRIVSGFLGSFTEDYLRQHCTNELFIGNFCLARFLSSIGWDENMRC